MKYSGIGGQAVMEGVMMRNQDQYAVAVRTTNGKIVVDVKEYKGILGKHPLTKMPFIRGIVSFIDSLVLGMGALNYSASFFEEEDEEAAKANREDTSQKWMMGLTIGLSILMAVAIFMVLPYGLSLLFTSIVSAPMILSLIEGIIKIAIFFAYIWLISRMKEIQRVFMYHGAEHKCINCIEHGMELNVENVKKSSRLHKRCGTSFLLIIIVVSVILFMFIQVESPVERLVIRLILIPIVAGIAYEFIRLAGRSENQVVQFLSKPGMALQKLTTSEPDEDMIEVGMASVEAVFDWKAYLAEWAQENENVEVKEYDI